ncbi:MAG: winged helix-turn-helix transcriptional regulator [Bacteroidetes bacterium]|nr:winged helix-turn-helix transcriptional regulator [Bacteroidota bacterium]
MNSNDSPYCNCLFYSVNALSRQITKMAEEEFAVTGLSPSYAFILMSVNKKPGILSGEVAKIMQLTPSTITRLIEKLEQKGYITREVSGKFSLLYPTKKSLAIEKTITKAWQSLYTRYVEVLGEKESKVLTDKVIYANRKLGS